ncbi:MAG TPA: ABC transporter ATP-binding protein [Phycisphaerae bacterium]|nr:ABC transporter ATP-binding protein [Phycisphaerae bacterium]
MSANEPIRRVPDTAEPPQTAGPGAEVLIRLEGVRKRFGGHEVFRDLTVGFRRGETAVVLGSSGVGKSVMLKLILGLLKPDAGRIWIDGAEVTALGESALIPLRTRFGMLFQGAALFDFLTVYENVAFALREHKRWSEDTIREVVRQKLALVDMDGTENLYPEELSGGMRKRVGLARAIAMDPEVILYDEPTTGLDPVTADTINELILRCQRELRTTSIVVTHDMASAYKVGDRLVMLDEGGVIADGPPEAIRRHPDIRVQRFIHGNASLAAAPPQGGTP